MKKLLAMASMILFVFAAQVFGFAFGAEQAAANDSINETLKITTLVNGTFENATLINGTSRMQLSKWRHLRMQLSSNRNT